MDYLKRLLLVIVVILAMAIFGGLIRYEVDSHFSTPTSTPYCMEDGHLHMGEIISKYSEKVDGDKFYYVTIAGKIDGRYHTRDIEVNKWMWVHTYRVGDYWSPSV